MATLLLCSGGSAFELLRDLDPRSFDAPLTVGVLDERFREDPFVNNFAQLRQTDFFQRATRVGASFIDTRVTVGESLEELAQRFERALREWRRENPDGKIIVTMGIGKDGHTAGIIPDNDDPVAFYELFDDSMHWVVGYDAGNRSPFPFRVTVTFPFLRTQVSRALVYAKGEEKQWAIKMIQADVGSLNQIPARIIREINLVEPHYDV